MTSEGYRTLLYRTVPYRAVPNYEILRFWSKSYKVSIYFYVSIFLKCIDTLIDLLKYHDILYRYVSILFGTWRIMICIDVPPPNHDMYRCAPPRIMIYIDVPPPNHDMYRCAPSASWCVLYRYIEICIDTCIKGICKISWCYRYIWMYRCGQIIL
jgi:hypothetical protein